jgi:hypothetical protein
VDVYYASQKDGPEIDMPYLQALSTAFHSELHHFYTSTVKTTTILDAQVDY